MRLFCINNIYYLILTIFTSILPVASLIFTVSQIFFPFSANPRGDSKEIFRSLLSNHASPVPTTSTVYSLSPSTKKVTVVQ
ncbi:TPA: hypothetical protein DIC40_05875 [Patescibacteria group bacterium]|nr:hypothetical protein [Candidatus Gracilibacteria bacterium]